MLVAYHALICGWALLHASRPPHSAKSPHTRAKSARCDADRCYYGAIDEEGNVVKGPREASAPIPKPSPSLSPLEVVDAQLEALSRDWRGDSGASAFAFLSPGIVAQYGLDLPRYKQILQGYQFDGLLGCAEWKVLRTESPTDERMVVHLDVRSC